MVAKRRQSTRGGAQAAPARAGNEVPAAFPIVGIGASAGGLEALKEFFSVMPAGSGMAFLVIQHLDPSHESLMAEILDKVTEMDVIPAADGTPVQVNTIYTIPTNTYLSIEKGVLHLSAPVKKDGMRLPIDFLFQNLAQDQGERAIGIILSGTGADGTSGLRAIREAGGTVIVQDPATAQFDGMPRNAIATGLVDFTLPVSEMPEALLGYVRHAYVKGRDSGGEPKAEAPDELHSILTLLARKANSDFRCYKKSTIQRRIERRMGLRQIPALGEYYKFLIENPGEVIVPTGARLRIMVVDDVADTATSLAELLELWGHEVRPAFDGTTALDQAHELHPEIVMLDIGMPGMDGYELARRLRQEFGDELLLVALTGYGQEEDRRRTAEAGFDRHLTKPVDLPALCDLISAFGMKKMHSAE